MKTPGVPRDLQTAIRKHFADTNWIVLSQYLGITLKSLQHQLSPTSPREMTYHFIGLLEVWKPGTMDIIRERYFK